MHIPEVILNQLNEQADLVRIIRRHTTLKPAGKEFKGCCPFHGEKTPSFFVNPESNLYYCFGCGAKGNAINFLVDYERLTFTEAVKTLSEQTGISLPTEARVQYRYKKTPSSPTPATTEAQQSNANFDQTPPIAKTPTPTPPPTNTADNHGNLYQLLNAVNHYYRTMLKSHTVAMDYLKQRGISQAMIDFFELGFAPSGWQHLQETFATDLEGLRMLGLLRTAQSGREFNLFRDRLIFPIKDRQGRIVGFAGRALTDDVSPKYINSSDSIVFQKQHILYGYYESRQARAKNWLIVEGYLDVIALYQAGIFGAVAPMGTAIHAGQISTLLKFNDTLTLCFDGDHAGQRAALRTLDVAMPLLTDGKQLKFLTLPNDHDPDTYTRHHGTVAMQTAIDSALPLSDYLYQILQSQYDLTRPENKAAAMAYAKTLIDKLPKGASFRWWLNHDLYRRLSQKKQRRQTANYETQQKINPATQLLLCLLYQPSLAMHIQTGDDNDPLIQLYRHAQILDSHHPFVAKFSNAGLAIPPLPDWSDIYTQVAGLQTLVIATKNALPHLLPTADRQQSIDAHAHFILMGVHDEALQTKLATHWRDFFYQINHHTMTDIRPLFDELLCHVIIACIRHTQSSTTQLLVSQLQKRRLLQLEQWHKNSLQAITPP